MDWVMIQAIGGNMVESLADENEKINLKCFEKICVACIKATILGLKIGDQALMILQRMLHSHEVSR
jgi:hypothetical protein